MFDRCLKNQLSFTYVLADSWFASADNLHHIAQKKKYFIFEIKPNRLSATSKEDKLAGQWTRIEELDLAENSLQTV